MTEADAQRRTARFGIKRSAWKRKRAKAAHSFKCDELRWVKDWIKSYHRNFKATVSGPGGDTPEAVASDARRYFNNLCDRYKAALDEIQQLQAENAALRERLSRYESTDPPVSPGSGRDMWRDGYGKRDVA